MEAHTEGRFTFGRVSAPDAEKVSREVDRLTAGFGIHCRGTLLKQLMEYAVSNKNTEVFGLLIGRAILTPAGKLRTIIEDYIPASELAVSTSVSVEVSPQEVMRMDSAFETSSKQRGFLKVGWFHTHPGHGVFMSATDRNNHALYQHNWQVALVLDPHTLKSGFFVGSNCERVDCVVDPDVTLANTENESAPGGGDRTTNAEDVLAGRHRNSAGGLVPEGTGDLHGPTTERSRGILSWFRRPFARKVSDSRGESSTRESRG